MSECIRHARIELDVTLHDIGRDRPGFYSADKVRDLVADAVRKLEKLDGIHIITVAVV